MVVDEEISEKLVSRYFLSSAYISELTEGRQ